MRIIRDDNFRTSNWRKIHGREVYHNIELLAKAVGMQSFEGRLNNEMSFPPRAALKTFYICPWEIKSRVVPLGKSTCHNIYWKSGKSWTSAKATFLDGTLQYVDKSYYGKVYGRETLISKRYEVLDADYEMLDVKIIEEN